MHSPPPEELGECSSDETFLYDTGPEENSIFLEGSVNSGSDVQMPGFDFGESDTQWSFLDTVHLDRDFDIPCPDCHSAPLSIMDSTYYPEWEHCDVSEYLPCSLCACLVSTSRSTSRMFIASEAHKRLFHESCATCDATQKSWRPCLCSFCAHLRLLHICSCLMPKLMEEEKSFRGCPTFEIFGQKCLRIMLDKTSIQMNTHCPMCTLWDQVMRGSINGRGDHEDDTVFLSINVGMSDPPILHTYYGNDLWGDFLAFRCLPTSCSTPSPLDFQTVGPTVNWELSRVWMNTCKTAHHTKEPPEHGSRIANMTLIDVSNKRLVSVDGTLPEYAALSYVWGKTLGTELFTTLANFEHLKRPGSLSSLRAPQTIKDTISTCSELGIQFLWVDRFCIIQDDEQSKHGQIQNMGDIFASAIVTIVAAFGEDAWAGLLGVSWNRPFEFIEPLNDAWRIDVKKSKWMKRGWTFQEAVLSAALLYFTEHGVFFEFQNEIKTESVVLEEQVPLFQGEDNTRYPIALREYTRRKLSYDTDILSAFSGYLQRFICEKHYYGLSRSTFDNHMTWTVGHNSRPNDGKFPSWSWTSFIGKVSISNSEVLPLATWAEPVVESFDSQNIKRLVLLGLSTIGSECWNLNY